MAKKKDYKKMIVSPLESHIKNFAQIVNFYMYEAPGVSSSTLSLGDFGIEDSKKIYDEMLESVGLSKKFIANGSINSGSWKKACFEDDIIDFEDMRALFIKNNKEENLNALLRHIRNALAHGNLYVWRKKSGNFIFFVDCNKKEKVTAKILVSDKVLSQWQQIIQKHIRAGELL